jgi:Fibronectin type III-like domain
LSCIKKVIIIEQRSGSEVVQLYIHDEGQHADPTAAGAEGCCQDHAAIRTQTVSLTLGMRAFAAYDDVRRAWVAEAGRFEVRLGASSADISQRAWVTLSTEWVDLVNREPTRFIIRVSLTDWASIEKVTDFRRRYLSTGPMLIRSSLQTCNTSF